MSTLATLLWLLATAGCLAGLYALHRLALWLEHKGWLYYWHKKPHGSAAGAFVALQRAIEPQASHVLVATDKKHDAPDQAKPGAGR